MAVSKEWAFQRSFLRKVYNREVNEYFRDVDDEILEEIDIPRKAAKRACLILPKESQTSALQKQLCFQYVVKRVQDRPDVYGIPIQEAQETFRFRPQVQIFFIQDSDAIPEGFQAIQGQLRFRIMNETSETITRNELIGYATRIKNEFALTNNDMLWKKGKYKMHYYDPENGLDSRILCLTESEGISIVQKLCRIVQATYSENKLTKITPNKDSVNIPGSHILLGDTYREPRWRPTGTVRFRYAVAHINGIPKAIALVDRTGRFYKTLA